MVDLQFNEDQEFSQPIAPSKQSAFVRFVLSTRLVETERGANYVLLGVAVIGLLFTFFSFSSNGDNTTSSQQLKEGQSAFLSSGTVAP